MGYKKLSDRMKDAYNSSYYVGDVYQLEQTLEEARAELADARKQLTLAVADYDDAIVANDAYAEYISTLEVELAQVRAERDAVTQDRDFILRKLNAAYDERDAARLAALRDAEQAAAVDDGLSYRAVCALLEAEQFKSKGSKP